MWALLGAALVAIIVVSFLWSTALVLGAALFIGVAINTGSIICWIIGIILGLLVIFTSTAV